MELAEEAIATLACNNIGTHFHNGELVGNAQRGGEGDLPLNDHGIGFALARIHRMIALTIAGREAGEPVVVLVFDRNG